MMFPLLGLVRCNTKAKKGAKYSYRPSAYYDMFIKVTKQCTKLSCMHNQKRHGYGFQFM